MAEHVKINAVVPFEESIANGSQLEFEFGFVIFEPSDLNVYLDGIEVTSGFTVAPATVWPGIGSVVWPSNLAAGTVVGLERAAPIQRLTDFADPGEFRALSLNDELDRTTIQIQDMDLAMQRSLRVPPGEAPGLALPSVADRANRVLAFDAAGAPTPTADLSLGAELRETDLFTTSAPDTVAVLTETPINDQVIKVWVEGRLQLGWTRSGKTITLTGTSAGLVMMVEYYYRYPFLAVTEAARVTYPVENGNERTLLQHVRDSPNIEEHGADPTAADNSAAINAMLALTGELHIPDGKRFLLKSALTRTGSLNLTGTGSLVWTADATSTGITVTLDSSDGSSSMVSIGRVQLRTKKKAEGWPLTVDATAQIVGVAVANRSHCRIAMEGTRVRGDNAPGVDGWLGGLRTYGVSNIELDGLYFVGHFSPNEAGILSQNAIQVDDQGNSAVLNLDRVSIYYHNQGLLYDGVEGVNLSQCNLVVCNTGVRAVNSNAGFAPQLTVTGTHFNCRVRSIDADGIQGVMIQGNFIWQRTSSTVDGTGVYLVDCDDIKINGNEFVGDYSNTGGLNYYGVLIGSGVTDCTVQGNTGQDVTYLAWAQAGSNNVLLSDNQISKEYSLHPGPGLYNNTSAGRVIIDAEVFSAKNAAIVTGAGGTLADVNMGTVYAGQKFQVTAQAVHTKGATAGETETTILKGAGTATVAFLHDAASIRQRAEQGIAGVAVHAPGGLMRVTGSGTLTLRAQYVSAGSDTTVAAGAAQLQAVQLGTSLRLG